MDGEVPSCFGDTAWTVAHPKLRSEVLRRVSARFRWRSPDRSDVVQEALNAAVRHRLLLKGLTPVQRSGWFWVVVGRMTAKFSRRRSKDALLLALQDAPEVEHLADPRSDEASKAIECEERVEVVRAAMKRLPEPWRRVLALRIRHPEDWQAVAEAGGWTEGAARGLWYRAMTALRDRMRKAEMLEESAG